MLEVLLIDLLRKEGLLTEDQIKDLASVQQLYDLLVIMKVIKPLSVDDRRVLDLVEAVMANKITLKAKIDQIEALEMVASDSSLKDVIKSLLKGAYQLEKSIV